MHGAMQEAQAQLLLMVEVLRDLDVQHKGGHTAAADMAYLYAMTQVWFTVERNYKVGPAQMCLPQSCVYAGLTHDPPATSLTRSYLQGLNEFP